MPSAGVARPTLTQGWQPQVTLIETMHLGWNATFTRQLVKKSRHCTDGHRSDW